MPAMNFAGLASPSVWHGHQRCLQNPAGAGVRANTILQISTPQINCLLLLMENFKQKLLILKKLSGKEIPGILLYR